MQIIKSPPNDQQSIQDAASANKKIAENNASQSKLVDSKSKPKVKPKNKTSSKKITPVPEEPAKNEHVWTGNNSKVLWLIGIAIIAVAALSISFFIMLRKSIRSIKIALEESIKKNHEEIKDTGLRLDDRLAELLEKNLTISREIASTIAGGNEKREVDHALPLRVGEEIYRMQNRLKTFPPEMKGLLPLQNSVERLKEEFTRQGYEIIDMVGEKYDYGMIVRARFILSHDLKEGENIISKVIKPQINYHDVAIQIAEIEVSSGG